MSHSDPLTACIRHRNSSRREEVGKIVMHNYLNKFYRILFFFFYRSLDACFLSNAASLKLWVTPTGHHFQKAIPFSTSASLVYYILFEFHSQKKELCEITGYTFTFSSGKNSSKTFSKPVLENINLISNFFAVTCTFAHLRSTYTQVAKSSKMSEVFSRWFNQQVAIEGTNTVMGKCFMFLDLSTTEANKL